MTATDAPHKDDWAKQARKAIRQTFVTRDEVIRFEDGEIRPVRFSRDGKQYRADMVRLQWLGRDGGGVWALTRAEIVGQVLKRDGSDSKNRTDETFYSTSKVPGWLRELIDDTDPTAPVHRHDRETTAEEADRA